jgi:hypothetical protein
MLDFSYWLINIATICWQKNIRILMVNDLYVERRWKVCWIHYDAYSTVNSWNTKNLAKETAILLCRIQLTNATEVQLWKWYFYMQFLVFMRPIHVRRSRTPSGVRCAHISSVITSIMDQKVQFDKTVEPRWVVYHVAEPSKTAIEPRVRIHH